MVTAEGVLILLRSCFCAKRDCHAFWINQEILQVVAYYRCNMGMMGLDVRVKLLRNEKYSFSFFAEVFIHRG